MRLLIFVLCVITALPLLAAADLPGLVPSADWKVTQDGVSVPVAAVKTLRGERTGLVRIVSDKRVSLEVALPVNASRSVEVLPRRPGALAVVKGETIHLSLPGPGVWTLVTQGGHECALHLLVQAPVKPPAGLRPELVFGPGLHEVDTITLRDGDTLWLDPAAVLRPRLPAASEKPVQEKDWAGMKVWRPFISAIGAKQVAIRGGGTIDLSGLPWHARNVAVFWQCEDITVDGLTILDAPTWGVASFQCQKAQLRGVVNISHRENSDGIDLCNSRDVLVEDCFFRTNDDGVCVKTTDPAPANIAENILVRRVTVWNERARALGITSETRQDIKNVRFTDCDVIRDYSAGGECCALAVLVADRGTMSDIVFERIRIEHCQDTLATLWIRADAWGKDKERGHINGVRFDQIDLAPGIQPRIRIEGFDATNRIENVSFKRLRLAGEPLADAPAAGLIANEFTAKISVEP